MPLGVMPPNNIVDQDAHKNHWDHSGTNITTLSVSPVALGNIIVLFANSNPNTSHISSVSGGGVTTWIAVNSGAFSTFASIWQSIWIGRVTTVGAATITINGTAGGAYNEIYADEFTAGLGALTVWTVQTSNIQINASSTTIPYPSLKTFAALPGAIYSGFAGNEQSASAGSTTGFSYIAGGNGEQSCYATQLAANTTYAPTAVESPAGRTLTAGIIVRGSLP